MIKHVLFDFDGTLADTRDIIVSIYNGLAARNRFEPIRPEDIPRMSRMSIPERCRVLGVPMYRLPALKRQSRNRFRESVPGIRLFEGIPEMLDGLLKLKVPLGIISSNEEDAIRTVLLQCGVAESFASISASSSLFGKDKTLRAFLRANKCAGHELLYVGDELRDIESCRKAGVRIAAVGWGLDHMELLRQHGPDLLAGSPADVLSYVVRENFGTIPV